MTRYRLPYRSKHWHHLSLNVVAKAMVKDGFAQLPDPRGLSAGPDINQLRRIYSQFTLVYLTKL